MIVVLGRPRAVLLQGAGSAVRYAPGGRAVAIARAAVAAGARVELVGAIGDDPAGDDLVVGLSREDIGHAALLRQPGAQTPADAPAGPATAQPRLDRGDVELGLGYLLECDVLVLADELPPDACDAALEAARYHGARVIAVVAAGSTPGDRLAAAATVLEAPAEEHAVFPALVGRMAAAMDGGRADEVGANPAVGGAVS